MERKCIRCNIVMNKAKFSAGEYAQVEEINKGSKAKVCLVDTYVCPKCGNIELVAEKPEMFDK